MLNANLLKNQNTFFEPFETSQRYGTTSLDGVRNENKIRNVSDTATVLWPDGRVLFQTKSTHYTEPT